MASLAGLRSVERHQETASARESSSSGMWAAARETTAQGPASPRLRPPYCVCACSVVLASASGTCPGVDCIATHRPVFERPTARGVASTLRLSERPHCDLAMAPGRLEKPPACFVPILIQNLYVAEPGLSETAHVCGIRAGKIDGILPQQHTWSRASTWTRGRRLRIWGFTNTRTHFRCNS